MKKINYHYTAVLLISYQEMIIDKNKQRPAKCLKTRKYICMVKFLNILNNLLYVATFNIEAKLR